MSFQRAIALAALACVASPASAESILLENARGLKWEIQRGPNGWVLGSILLRGKPVDASLNQGAILLRHASGRQRWLPAAEAKKTDGRTALLTGKADVDGAALAFQIEIKLRDDMPAAGFAPRWSVDKDLAGYEVCLPCFDVSANQWRSTLYPFAGNAGELSQARLTYCGVAAAIVFRPDMSLVALYGIDPASDYLNPTTWTGSTGIHFKNGSVPPQFRLGGGKLTAHTDYLLPLQVFFSDAGNSADAICQLVRGWIKANDYRIEPLCIRTPQEAFELYLKGRRISQLWNPGKGYRINSGWNIIYIAESPANAWFDYLLYEHTGETMWRERAFQTMDFALKAQHTDPADPHCGVLETNYELADNQKAWYWGVGSHEPPFVGDRADLELKTRRFNSADHSPNFGFKLDMNGYAATYMLKLWQRVKQKEGLDKNEWREAAIRTADWIVRQQNPDGGLPQVVDYRRGAKPSISVISGRTLVGMPTIARITGDKKYARLAEDLEQFLRTQVEGRYWFTGAHVDLWPGDFESDSVWHAVEYWLDKHDRTREPECLRRAEADARFAFLMWCPKQLPWVKNPTQTCHAEQQHYLQYSNYCYNNRKYDCLDRLARTTGDPWFGQLRDRIMQCGFWGQVTSGEWTGAQYERLSDPWKSVSQDIDSKGIPYFCELALEANLQLLEMGLAQPQPRAEKPGGENGKH